MRPRFLSHGVARLERCTLATSPDHERAIAPNRGRQLRGEIQLRVDVERRLGPRRRAFIVRYVRGVVAAYVAELEREAAAAEWARGTWSPARRQGRELGDAARSSIDENPGEAKAKHASESGGEPAKEKPRVAKTRNVGCIEDTVKEWPLKGGSVDASVTWRLP